MEKLPRIVKRIFRQCNFSDKKLLEKSPCALLTKGHSVAVLLGTAHDSAISVRRVKDVASMLGDSVDSVAIEMCIERVPLGEPRWLDTIPYYPTARKECNIVQGSHDMQQAIVSAVHDCGANIYLIDRSIEETKRRFREKLSKGHYVKILTLAGKFRDSFGDSFEPLGNMAVALDALPPEERMQLVDAFGPDVVAELLAAGRVISTERDEVLAANLARVVQEGKLTLAVAGAAHLPGICDRWIKYGGDVLLRNTDRTRSLLLLSRQQHPAPCLPVYGWFPSRQALPAMPPPLNK